ncbi:MAG: 16S/23S rRNA (cytidine-2'-O)-methyltransferase, partial [Gammaproteobacteria bacterium]|nr:16S/23S rRNA (cytidine-2'-O)-methyltransferase [Gammaproteobacteria bacterium]
MTDPFTRRDAIAGLAAAAFGAALARRAFAV